MKPLLKTEFNIEGYPGKEFIDLVLKVKPTQVTLVPDAPDAITSNAGWDVKTNFDLLSELVDTFTIKGIRTSIFVGTGLSNIEQAAKTGTDRIELYTEPYAGFYNKNKEAAVAPFIEAARLAKNLGLGVNAGHDLSLENLSYIHGRIPWLEEVSIGHALICDSLYFGLKETIALYKKQLVEQ
jgi:pyridoxine 5-phosphate synthase